MTDSEMEHFTQYMKAQNDRWFMVHKHDIEMTSQAIRNAPNYMALKEVLDRVERLINSLRNYLDSHEQEYKSKSK